MSKNTLRTSAGACSSTVRVCWPRRLPPPNACTQADEEHDDGGGQLSPISSARALAPKFDGAHLDAGHKGAVAPAKQQPRGAQRKGLEDLQARLDASEARARERGAMFEDARAAAADFADARAAVESELVQEHAALDQEREPTTELEGRHYLELDLESPARRNDNAVRLVVRWSASCRTRRARRSAGGRWLWRGRPRR